MRLFVLEVQAEFSEQATGMVVVIQESAVGVDAIGFYPLVNKEALRRLRMMEQ